ncbi:MAG: glycerophosphoryl diester phosphodiesterase membrane domain-containing protein, partial [Bulleidia sp.]
MKKWFHTLSSQILNTLLWVFPYQLTVSILLAVLTAVLKRIGLFFVASAGEAAITNGNYRIFFSRWQGWALLALGVFACDLYICLDIGALIRITDLKLHGRKERILTSCMQSLKLLPKFFTPSGFLILLVVTFGVPLTNIGFSITLTEGFYIPNVYSADLMNNPVTRILYYAGVAFLAVLITKGLFTIHFMVLQKESPKNAFLHSAGLTKSFFLRFLLLFLGLTILFYGLGKGISALVLTLPDWLISAYVPIAGVQRFLYLLFNLNGVIILFLVRII